MPVFAVGDGSIVLFEDSVVLAARAFSGALHVGGSAGELRNQSYRGQAPESFFSEADWIYRGMPETEI